MIAGRGSRLAVRAVLAVLALLDIGTGLWAVLAPADWYTNFPGLGRHWVVSTGPLNEHLVTDAGAGFLAIGAALLVAALWMARPAIITALAAVLAQGVPHFIFHISHPDSALGTIDVVIGVWGIGFECAVAFALAVVVARWGRSSGGRAAAAEGSRAPQ
jgi:hypothetical protein